MALEKPLNIDDVYLAGPQHAQAFHKYRRELVTDTVLQLVPEPANPYDRCAVSVRYRGEHVGYIPRTHSEQVARLIQKIGPMQATIRDINMLLRLDYVRTQAEVSRMKLPTVPLIQIPSGDSSKLGMAKLRELPIGTRLNLETDTRRTSVSVVLAGVTLSWFRKSEVDDPDDTIIEALEEREMTAILITSNPPVIQLWTTSELPPEQPRAAGKQPALAAPYGGFIDFAGSADSVNEANAIFTTEATTGTAAVTTTPTTKETTMSAFNAILNSNKSAAIVAATMEAGRIANNQVAKLAAKKLPMMVRGYADTPVGKLVIANMAAQAAKHFRPEDTTLCALTDAMTVQAYQELIQVMDVEGFLDNLMDSPEIKRAVKKLNSAKPKATDE